MDRPPLPIGVYVNLIWFIQNPRVIIGYDRETYIVNYIFIHVILDQPHSQLRGHFIIRHSRSTVLNNYSGRSIAQNLTIAIGIVKRLNRVKLIYRGILSTFLLLAAPATVVHTLALYHSCKALAPLLEISEGAISR